MLASLATRLLSVTVLLWVNQHLLKRIDPEEYSLFPLVMSLMVFSDLFVAFFVGGISRHLVEAHHRADPGEVTRIVSSMLVVLVPVALVLGLVGAAAAWRIDALLELSPERVPQARFMLLLTIFTLAVTTATTPLAQGLYVHERFVTDNLLGLVCELLRIALLLTLLLCAGTGVTWLVVASSAATLVNRAALIVWTRRLVPAARFAPAMVSRATTARVLAFGAWTSVHGIGQLITWTVPVLLLNRFASALDVATFHAGRLADVQIRNLLQAVEGPAQPALVGLYAREGRGAVNQLYYRGGRYSLWLVLMPVAPLLVFATPLYRLYAGEEYARAGWVMLALLASYPFQYASAMYYRVAHAIGRVGRFHACFLALQLVAVAAVGYAVVLRGAGAVGAAAALGLVFGLLHVLWIWPLGLLLVNGRWRDFASETLARGLAPFVAALGASLLLARWIAGDSWWSLGLAAGVALLVYLATLRLWCLDALDRELLGRLRSKLGARLARGSAR